MDHFSTPPVRRAIDAGIAEANHRIANSLTLLVSIVRMQAEKIGRAPQPLGNAETRLMLESVAARITTIGQLHRFLAHVPECEVIELNSYLREFCTSLVAAFSSPGQRVQVEHSGPDCIILTRYIQPLVLVLSEIFLNAMKYAHPTGVPLHLRVDCRSGVDQNLVVTIGDDGVGLPENFESQKESGIGFRVIRGLIADMGASLEIDSSPLGATFRVTIPGAAMTRAKLA